MKDKWTFKYTISGPTQDPYLLIEFLNESLALLFDCGVRVWGRVKVILKIDHLFITHAHIDHLIGFDHILRALLGEEKVLKIYGPLGIEDRIAAKLNAYDWDRAADQGLVLEVYSFGQNRMVKRTHECRKRFAIVEEKVTEGWDGLVLNQNNFNVRAVEVDHGGSPCLAYSFEEKDYARIDKDKLTDLGLKPGPWVGQFLKAIECGDEFKNEIEFPENSPSWEELKDQIVLFQKGKKLTYVTDTGYSDEICSRVAGLAKKSDILFCESTFLHEDARLAEQYHHMTAKYAATVAQRAAVDRLVLFHVSSRYFPKIDRVIQEAREIFPRTDLSNSTSKSRKSKRSFSTDSE